VALAGAVAAVLALVGGLVSALVAYGLAAAVTATLVWWAPRHRENAADAGVLRRVLTRAERLAAGPLAAEQSETTGREAA
jgi:uncharacterized membrane protein required for colicin V production